MKRALLAISVCVCMPSSRALAVDWSVFASLTETTELHDNQFLRSMLAGGSLASYSTVGGRAVATTSTSRFVVDADVRYSKFWGPGTEGIPQTESTGNSINAHYETFEKYSSDRQYIDASWTRQSAALAVLSELGILTPTTGDISNVALKGGIERDLTARDSASVSARSSLSYYDPSSAGTQFLDTTVTATWKHKLSATTSLRASSEVEWLSYDNAARTNILILRDLAGVDMALTPLLDFHGSAGVAHLQTSQRAVLDPIAPPTPIITGSLTPGAGGSSLGFIGDMVLTYRVLKKTTVSFNANQTITPTVVGALVQSTAFGADLAHTINQFSALSFSGNFSRVTGSGSSDFMSFSAGYSRALAREWNAYLTYRYLRRSGSSGNAALLDPILGLPLITGQGPASDNSISLVISHNITLLPPGN